MNREEIENAVQDEIHKHLKVTGEMSGIVAIAVADRLSSEGGGSETTGGWVDGEIEPKVKSKSYWCECENLTHKIYKGKRFCAIHFYNSGGFWNLGNTAQKVPEHIKIHRYTELPTPPKGNKGEE
jgi:hypothetical protein